MKKSDVFIEIKSNQLWASLAAFIKPDPCCSLAGADWGKLSPSPTTSISSGGFG